MYKKYLLIRMLGNDLESLHGSEQTYINLDFTIKYEYNFDNTDKIYVLNRIVDKNKKEKIINLLNDNNLKYIDIPFDINEFKKLPIIKCNFNHFQRIKFNLKVKILLKHNLYLINNNSCRNFCIDYGKQNGYEWIFVLDSNSFFIKESFNNIINNINESTEYLIIPQKRLADNYLSNDHLKDLIYDNDLLNNLPNQEPQIAFKSTSKYIFNSDIPYGLSPKAELLNAFNIPGKWNNWNHHLHVNIVCRKIDNVKYQTLSSVIRLQPHNKHNNIKYNWLKRWDGLFLLVKNIQLYYN